MDAVPVIVPEFIKDIAKDCAKDMVKDLAGVTREKTDMFAGIPQEQMDAKIEKIFTDKMVTVMKQQVYLQNQVLETRQELQRDAEKQIVLNESIPLEKIVHSLDQFHKKYLQFPTSSKARRQFRQSYKQSGLLLEISFLHARMTSDNGKGEKFIDGVVKSFRSDWKSFEQWSDKILRTLSDACYLHVTYKLKCVPHENISLKALNKAIHFWNETILGGAEVEQLRTSAELQQLQQIMKEIIVELKNGLLKVKSHFLVKKCGDPEHTKCGAHGDETVCCELGSNIYKYLYDTRNLDFGNSDLARPLADRLRKKYPQFEWSVVIFEQHDSDGVSMRYVDPERKSCVWQQTLGTQPPIWGMAAKDASNDSTGLEFGQFLCYRYKSDKPKRQALVFWTEREKVLAGKTFHSLVHPSPPTDGFPTSSENVSRSAADVDEEKEVKLFPKEIKDGLMLEELLNTKLEFKHRLNIFLRLWEGEVGYKRLLFLACETKGPFQLALAKVDGVQFPLDLNACMGPEASATTFNLAWFVQNDIEKD